jgi:biopolymer transport protein ExbD
VHHEEKFARRHRVSARIPSVAMGSMALLLLIFFMATTILRTDSGIQVGLPGAQTGAPVLNVWLDRTSRVWINQEPVAGDQLSDRVALEMAARPGLVVAFGADERVPYRAVAAILDQLEDANAFRVSFTGELLSTPGPR